MNSKLFLFALALSCIGIHCMAQESRFIQQEIDSLVYIKYRKGVSDEERLKFARTVNMNDCGE